MIEQNTDLRMIRTRKFIIDSFIQLLEKKDFNSITIKDITSGAMVNRATFYHHFVDKFDLLEKVIKKELTSNVLKELTNIEDFNDQMLKSVFISITKFHMSLSERCQRSFDDMSVNIEAILKKELEGIFFQSLQKKYKDEDNEELRITATLLSWMIYSAAVDWRLHSEKSPEDYFEYAIVSFKKLVKN